MNKAICKSLKAIAMLMAFTFVANVNAQTGDGFVDSVIQGAQYSAGNNTSPSSLKVSEYPNGVDKCNSSQAPGGEGNCPSDMLYTPNANTGGYQAFGAGIKNYPGGNIAYPLCYIDYYWDGDGYSLILSCGYVVVSYPDFTYGVAAANIQFGSDSTSTSLWGNKPMSTLSFKANSEYTPHDSSVSCLPVNPVSSSGSSPCNPALQNVYAVDNSGYEDKILIDDSNCTVGSRSGDASDADHNCFVGSEWLTNFPAPYPDTTAMDEPEVYVPGVGSSEPEAIQEDTTYIWYVAFYQWGFELSPSGNEVRHNSAVTHYADMPFMNCDSANLWNCYYNVDQTTIAPEDNF